MGRQFLFGAVAALVSAALTLALVETALRFADYPPLPVSGWRSKDAKATNELGYRGRPISYSSDDTVVLLVGDSQVQCNACPDDQMSEILLEDALKRTIQNVRVIALGAISYGQDQELLALREYFARGYRADVVLLWQTFANDVWNNTFRDHGLRDRAAPLKPTFRLVGRRLVGPTEHIGGPVTRWRTAALILDAFPGALAAWWDFTLPTSYSPYGAADLPGIVIDTEDTIDRERSPWSIWLTPRSQRMTYSIALTRALLSEMKNLAAKHGAGFFAFSEDRFSPASVRRLEATRFAPFFRSEPQWVRYRGAYFRVDPEQYLQTWAEINEGLKFYPIPILQVDHLVSDEDPHLNVAGTKQVLQSLADRLALSMSGSRPHSQLLP